MLKALYDDALESVMELLVREQDFRKLARAVYAKWKEVEKERNLVG